MEGEVYRNELRNLPYGDALWYPEPKPGSGVVQVGDVGYISHGAFIRLFNIVDPDAYPVSGSSFPEDLKRFQRSWEPWEDVRQRALEPYSYSSKSVRCTKVGLGVVGTAYVACIHFSKICTDICSRSTGLWVLEPAQESSGHTYARRSEGRH